MQKATDRKRGMLRLVKSSNPDSERKPMTDSEKYYKQVEQYAEQIRSTRNADEIIKILDAVLSETRGIKFSDEAFAAQEQVKRAEQKIESLKSEIEQLRSLVQTDQMTGAFNRRGLDDIFRREAARADRNAQSLGVVMVDLDNFKKINDCLGHPCGDNVLINLVAVAKETLRPTDVVVRFGGEEFVILLPDVEMDEALTIVQRIQNNLAKSTALSLEDQLMPITFSAGIALRSFGENQHSVISRADKALYQAKRMGKNRAIPSMAS
ncbi:MAG TPA: GGDEF domain-containing protein [Nitrosomonas sp.]|nr:GGDEF domain-containing protein [Nitrosomonas sp.]HQX12566.1 GGDEF domain-containing protein [Nitrosomonas sp.]HRB32174.1 GGDEF domain-containing protein [Nitrosomonas sp.]HRB44836.1 GGDEF domain-containing protein [Nitrosomonas sp.]HRB77107.1 GGDEF domain-containing protein [Nitrosomonas sp.]